ncbi:MAG: 3'-5' exonuclease [Clostridia bacterium]|nr:3'-5' exonuclease [Clostridia bacterium]
MATKRKTDIEIPESYIVFDIETTGFTPDRAEIIEIGAIRMVNGQPDGAFQSYIKPYGYLPLQITALTGITTEMLDDAPRIDAVIPRFLRFLDENPLPLVAHNSAFDCRFLTAYCAALGENFTSYTVVDSLKLARAYVPIKCHKLEVLKDHFGLKINSHNAVDDCRVTAYLVEWCRNARKQIKES